MEGYVHIGKIVAVFGIHGEVLLQHKLGPISWEQIDAVFIEEKKGSLLPYFIESRRQKSDAEIYLHLENVAVREQALRLLRRPVFMTEKDFQKNVHPSTPLALLGFTVVDRQKGTLGPLEEVIEAPGQLLIRLDYHGKEVLIPLHEQILEKIDRKHKTIHVTLPEGLLEI